MVSQVIKMVAPVSQELFKYYVEGLINNFWSLWPQECFPWYKMNILLFLLEVHDDIAVPSLNHFIEKEFIPICLHLVHNSLITPNPRIGLFGS